MTFDLNNWYWFVAGDTSQVYSSASHSYVAVADSTYQAWLADGGITTNIATFIDLIDVLSPEPGAAITEDFSSTSVNPTTGGPWTFTVTAGRFFPIGGTLLIRPLADWTIALIGEVSAYNSTSLTVTLRATNATVSQAYTSWSIALLDSPPAKMPVLSIVGLSVDTSDIASANSPVTIEPGYVMDSSGTVLLSLETAITKYLDVDWAAGTNQGGIFRTPLAGTVTAAGSTITGSGTTFTIDLSYPDALTDYVNSGGVEHDISSSSIVSTDSDSAEVVTITNNTSMAVNPTLAGAAGAAYYRNGFFAQTTTGQWFPTLIRKDSDGSIDAVFACSTVSGEPDMPSGYTRYRVIAALDNVSGAGIVEHHIHNNAPFAPIQGAYVSWASAGQPTLPNDRVLGESTSVLRSVGASTVTLLRAALTGDVTASQNSNTTTIANDVVTYAKMQNVSATSRVLGRITSGAGDVEELTGANVATILGTAIREKLTAARTYYVRTDGSDSNTGLADSSGGAFLTIQKAVDTVAGLDTGGQTVTIHVSATGTYTGTVILRAVTGVTGLGQLIIKGDTSTPSNVHVSVTGSCFTASGIGFQSVWDIKDMKLTGSAACLNVNGSYVRWGNLVFGVSSGPHISVVTQGKAVCLSSYHISGGASAHFYAESNAFIFAANFTVTMDASVTITNFAQIIMGSVMVAHGMTYTLGAFSVTGTRFYVADCANIFTGGGGANYFPGNSAGSGTNPSASPYGRYQ
jgi:hypothetical protein